MCALTLWESHPHSACPLSRMLSSTRQTHHGTQVRRQELSPQDLQIQSLKQADAASKLRISELEHALKVSSMSASAPGTGAQPISYRSRS